MKNQPFAYFLLAFICGILLQEYYSVEIFIFFIIIFLLLFLFLSKYKNTPKFIIFSLSSFLLFGFFIKYKTDLKILDNSESNKKSIHQYKISQQLGQSEKYSKYKAIALYPTSEVTYNTLLYVPKEQTILFPDDRVLVYGRTSSLPKKLNPYSFDYGKYLKNQEIFQQFFASEIIEIEKGNGFYNWSAKSKDQLLKKMHVFGFDDEVVGLVGAMILGTYSELNPELYQAYINSGVVHILSISGLHVMMIFMILMFLTKPLRKLKNGIKIRVIFCILIIWFYAIYVELKPPVFRSALMISIFYLSFLLNRKSNIYHTLALSALLILIFKPNYLFDVGFQLSYSAVFFMVWLNPIFDDWLWKGNKISQYFKALFVTSISAQFGTMPFATFYFNQFSWLFLLGNLVLIPASFIMMIFGIICVLGLVIDWIPDFFVWSFNAFIQIINQYISIISNWDSMIWRNLYISPLTSFLLIVVLIFIPIAIKQKSKFAFLIIVIALFFNVSHRWIDIHQKEKIEELVIFQQYKQTLIGAKIGDDFLVFSSNLEDSIKWKKFVIQPYINHQRIKNVQIFDIEEKLSFRDFSKSKSFIHWKNQLIYLGNSLQLGSLFVDYYLIRENQLATANLSFLETKRIIADASNYPLYIKKLDSLSLENQPKIWFTSEDGAFRLDFSDYR